MLDAARHLHVLKIPAEDEDKRHWASLEIAAKNAVVVEGGNLEKFLPCVCYGYDGSVLYYGPWYFELMLSVAPHMNPSDPVSSILNTMDENHRLGVLSSLALRATKKYLQLYVTPLSKYGKDGKFNVGGWVVVAYRQALASSAKWIPLNPIYSGSIAFE